MTPDQIIQLRILLFEIFAIADNDEPDDEPLCSFPKIKKLADQALALLPCPTCNGTGKKMSTDFHGGTFGNYLPCSDCQPKYCVCCEEITEENAHLHRNCGK